ncbi:TrkA family potassium uptake protein [Limibacter armeniacum]|uniref:potassium channel family protein n=1 Tax=Limibacter armeniacum TaxID=466084 RepID=UPI002FE6C17D
MIHFSSNQRYVLIGMGAFGLEIARTLQKHGADFMIILHVEGDNPNKALDDYFSLDRMRQEGFQHVYETDVTNPNALNRHVKPSDCVVLSHGKDFETKILTVDALKQIGVKNIYARATRESHARILSEMGVRKVVFPEKQEGKRLGLALLNQKVKTMDEIAPQVYIIEVPVPDEFVGKSILEVKVRSRYSVTIICLKETIYTDEGQPEEVVYTKGFETMILKTTHSMVIAGEGSSIKELTSMVRASSSEEKMKWD